MIFVQLITLKVYEVLKKKDVSYFLALFDYVQIARFLLTRKLRQ